MDRQSLQGDKGIAIPASPLEPGQERHTQHYQIFVSLGLCRWGVPSSRHPQSNPGSIHFCLFSIVRVCLLPDPCSCDFSGLISQARPASPGVAMSKLLGADQQGKWQG
jgi:hypothetical protein